MLRPTVRGLSRSGKAARTRRARQRRWKTDAQLWQNWFWLGRSPPARARARACERGVNDWL